MHRRYKLSTQWYGVDATGLGLALLGDTIAANLFMLGYASQLGLLPVSPEAIERAVEINGVAVPFNKAAFALGRLQAVDRSEEHTSELQSLMRISYAVFCLQKKNKHSSTS